MKANQNKGANMTREPKDYEIWYVRLPDGSIKPAVAFIPPNPKNTVWYIDGDTCCADPIAPVASHELVAELVEALQDLFLVDKMFIKDWKEDSPLGKAQAVLAKAKLAGLCPRKAVRGAKP